MSLLRRDPPTVVLLASHAPSLTTFRGALIAEMVGRGMRVLAAAPNIEPTIEGELRALGAETCSLPLSRTGMNPLGDLHYFVTLLDLFRRQRPDVVLAYTIKPVVWGLLAAALSRVPRKTAIITGVGYAFTEGAEGGPRHWLASVIATILYRFSLLFADRVIFQNPDDRDLFRSRRLLNDFKKTSLVDGSGVDLNHYVPVPTVAEPIFLMISRLLTSKGVREYVSAAKILKRRYPEARFLLVGWLDPGPDAINANEVQSWSPAVEFLGSREDVRPTLSRCAVYVLPSYREGTPRSVLEAMAMGRPIVTTDAPGCRETVEHGVNGYLVPVRDAAALAEAMERFIIRPETIDTMGAASLEVARRRYDVHKVNAQILAAMAEVGS